MNSITNRRALLLASAMVIITAASIGLRADTGTCGGQMITLPFTDVSSSNIFFCSIAEAYFSGLTNGTTPTTYSPSANVPREQMAAFITRTQDSAIKRGSRRAALGQWWTLLNPAASRTTSVGGHPQFLACDGADVWVSCFGSQERVRASDGEVLYFDTFFQAGTGIVIAAGYTWYIALLHPTDSTDTYLIKFDPTTNTAYPLFLSPGVQLNPVGMTFDGVNIWTANFSVGGGVTRFNTSTNAMTTFTASFSKPFDILFDGANLWTTDFPSNTLKRVDTTTGTVLQTVITGVNPRSVIFDGANLWVTNFGSDSISIVRASTGAVVATLTGNGLSTPAGLAFDGERVLVANSGNDSVSLWKAADLSPIGNFPMPPGSGPIGVCSDGIGFWVALYNSNQIVRF